MKRLLLLLVFMAKVVLSIAQPKGVVDGFPEDSTTFTFELTDSLNHSLIPERVDTTGAKLWIVGSTSKPFFTSGASSLYAIMTDTSQPYPVNADDRFTLKLNRQKNTGNFNVIVSFWHKYQTTAGHDGGVVEFSIDNGANWQNVMDSCNSDSVWWEPGVKTTDFYTKDDTLLNGAWAFSGTSNGWMYSRLQFFWGPPEKGTAQYCLPNNSVYIRFRFISDDTAESLAGWIIDDIKVEHDHYEGGIVQGLSNADNYRPYPNPSHDGIFFLPELKNEGQYKVEIYNTMGAKVFNSPYMRWIDLHVLPEGVYFYKVTNGETGYSGKLLLQ